eukprot:COSAG02_NODE_3184_length_7215_cov_12.871417_4_plen_50_part_00
MWLIYLAVILAYSLFYSSIAIKALYFYNSSSDSNSLAIVPLWLFQKMHQ